MAICQFFEKTMSNGYRLLLSGPREKGSAVTYNSCLLSESRIIAAMIDEAGRTLMVLVEGHMTCARI